MRLNKPTLHLAIDPRCEPQEMLGTDADIEDLIGLGRSFSLPLQFGCGNNTQKKNLHLFPLHQCYPTHVAWIGAYTQGKRLHPIYHYVTLVTCRWGP